MPTRDLNRVRFACETAEGHRNVARALAVTEIRQLIEEVQTHFEDRRLYLSPIHIHIFQKYLF